MRLSDKQKIRIIELYWSTGSFTRARRAFCNECGFTFKKGPTIKNIKKTVIHFKEKGTVHNISKQKSGRSPLVTMNEITINEVRESVTLTPKKSLSRRALELDLSPTSLYRILRRKMNQFPYRISVRHSLSVQDKVRRNEMCEWALERLDQMPDWLNHIWFSDESHFHLNGAVNNHNNIYWGTSPPDETTERNLKGAKVTCFVAFNAKHGLVGPFWFEEDNKTVTINAVRYRSVIRRFNTALTRLLSPNQRRQAWFMQDGAPPHTAHDTIAFLKELFQTRLIALGTNHAWAPHSPDLNPLDFWLWGAAKDVVYKEKPATLRELKVNVTNYIRQVTPEVWGKVGNNFSVRLQACQKREGAHIEHINYRKLVDA